MTPSKIVAINTTMQEIPIQYDSLSDEQKKAVKLFESGSNLFITGPGGTGKSYLTKYLVEKYPFIVATGSTGVAALNVKGRTLHNFMSVGLAEDSAQELYNAIKFRKAAMSRLKNCKALLIDEVSMIGEKFLDKVDIIFKLVKNNNKPFGGVQIVFVGDGLQLPSVQKDQKPFFRSRSWVEANPKVINLITPFRQKEAEFVNNLNSVRMGNITPAVMDYFNKRVGQIYSGEFEPINIYTTNRDVERINNEKLAKIKGEEKMYRAFDFGEPSLLANLDKNCPALKEINIKIGAQVMLLVNLDVEGGLVNGSVGKVTKFTSQGFPMVKFTNGTELEIQYENWDINERYECGKDALGATAYAKRVIASRKQIPLKICYAITVHKSQGSTLDLAIINLSNIFEFGLAYVALSRVKDINSVYIDGIDWSRVSACPQALEYYEEISKQ